MTTRKIMLKNHSAISDQKKNPLSLLCTHQAKGQYLAELIVSEVCGINLMAKLHKWMMVAVG